jgi:hypothetical protein
MSDMLSVSRSSQSTPQAPIVQEADEAGGSVLGMCCFPLLYHLVLSGYHPASTHGIVTDPQTQPLHRTGRRVYYWMLLER